MVSGRVRLKPAERRKIILAAAFVAYDSVGVFTYQDVADLCKVKTSRNTVRYYFPTIGELKNALQNSARD